MITEFKNLRKPEKVFLSTADKYEEWLFADPRREESQIKIYLFKVNDRNTRKRCEICSKLTIKTPERRH